MTLPLPRESHIPLYVQIEQEILASISSGKLKAYEKVLSEPELAERFGVSRMTARKALDRLASEGIIFRQPGKGTFVAPPKISHGFTTQTSFSATMDELGLRHTTRVIEASLNPAPAAVAAALHIAPGTATILIERLRLVDDEPAALHSTYLPARFARVLEEDLTTSLTALFRKIGAPIVAAHDAIEAVTATGDEAGLLGTKRGAPLLRLVGIGLSAGGDPLRYTDAYYRGDRFRFELDRQGSDLESKLVLTSTAVPHETPAS
jgi:GntR family transcriptional regulator